jgi:membrane protease YdiL (CAAX protease family)
MAPSEVSSRSVSGSSRVKQLMRRYPLLVFFFIAYAGSWIVTLPYVLSVWGFLSGDYSIGYILKPFVGPTLAAIIMIGVIEGKVGFLSLRDRLKERHVGWRWYLFILLIIPVLILIGIIVQPGLLASFNGLTTTLLVTYPAYFFIVFFGVALPEEIGWRGFALPRMQPRYGPLWGTLLLGVLWAFWHLLYFLTPAHGGGPGTNLTTVIINFSIFFLIVMAFTIIFTWVFNRTKESVFIANLLHASIDTPQLVWIPLFLVVNETSLNLASLISFGIPALLIIILTRGRLGYQPNQTKF